MKRAHYLIISFLLCGACGQHTDLAQTRVLMTTLDNSNRFISSHIDKLELSLQDKRFDPRTAEVTKIWLPRAEAISKLCEEMHTYLDDLTSALKTQARIISDTTGDSPRWRDKYPVYDLFEKAGRKKELSMKIAAYNKALLNAWNPDSLLVSDGIKEDIKITIPRMLTHVPEDLIHRFDPENTTTAMAYIMLSQIENDLLLTEHEMIRYADLHIGFINDGLYEELSVLAGVNSSYLKAGQTLTIDAGVGKFSLAAAPKITINGIPIKLNTEGVAEYSIVVGNTPGKHTIPIKIECVRPDGSPMTIKKDIKYEIAP